MTKSRIIPVFTDLQYKWIYLPSMFVRSLVPFGMNLILASFFVVLFTSAENGDLPQLYAGLRLTALLACGMCVIMAASFYLTEYSITKTTAHFRKKLFNHIQRLSYGDSQAYHSGQLLSRLTNDIKAMEGVYGENLVRVSEAILSGVLSLVVMVLYNWRLALIIVGMGLVFSAINAWFLKPMRVISQKVQESLGVLTESLSNILASASITRMFGLQDKIQAEYETLNRECLDFSLNRVWKNSLLNGVNYLTSFMGFGGLMIIGGFFVLEGWATFGTILFMVQMQNNVNTLFNQMGNRITQMQTSLAGADRVLEILSTPAEPETFGTQQKMGYVNGAAIALRNVAFGYGEGNKVFEDLSFQVPRGKVYALVGSSGGGKSTVFKLLLGFYPVDSGEIVIDGNLLSQTPLRSLRAKMAYVPQDAHLFAGTIRENISYGKPQASLDEITAAAQAANAHDFICELSDGYDTTVGERGAHLSGGQRQRIAIARAILKDAPVLLLDEATSALDNESESLVQQALDQLMQGKTTLVVAHRLSTIENADCILVMDQGKVVESGTHKALLENEQGIYHNLYTLQFREEPERVS